MLAALKQLFSPSALKRQAHDAYVQIVNQARNPVFYRDWQVEDSVDGRFDVIVLHLALVLSRLELESRNDTNQFHQYLSETFFDDMDRSLREMGSTDTGVGIRVKKMAQAFYGRMTSYRDALGDETALFDALKRNVYRERAVRPEAIASLAAYMGRNRAALASQSIDAIIGGSIAFSG